MSADFYLVNRRIRRQQSAIAAILGATLMYAVYLWPSADEPAVPSSHITIPAPLFDIARTVCKNNGGYKDVIIERASDQFTFRCMDGMTLKDAIVRVK